MTKWLYFRSTASVADDDGFISSASGNNNSSLRSSALLKYENLEAILPFTADDDEYPQGGSAADYTGVMMVFKAALTTGYSQDAPPDENYLHPFGKSSVKKEGNDITFLTYGLMVHKTLEVANILENDFNDDCEVIAVYYTHLTQPTKRIV